MDAQPHCAEEPELLPRLVCDDISGLSLGASSTQTHTAARTHTQIETQHRQYCAGTDIFKYKINAVKYRADESGKEMECTNKSSDLHLACIYWSQRGKKMKM